MGGRGGQSHGAGGGGGEFKAAQDFFRQAYGAKHAKAIVDLLQKAPENIQQLFKDYVKQFRAQHLAPGDDKEGAWYSPSLDAVFLDIGYVSRGDVISQPYQTIFHEYGHMIDSLIARDMGSSGFVHYSELYKGGLLARTAERELQTRIFSIMQSKEGMTREQAIDALIRGARQSYSMRDRSDLSDIMEGAGIGREYPLGAGHGLSYWAGYSGTGKRGTEIFAEITDALATSPGALRAIRDYFPETYAVYQDMIRERVKK
jgi:hypothetical protein